MRRSRIQPGARAQRSQQHPLHSAFEFWCAVGDSEMSGIATTSGRPVGYPPGNGALWRMGNQRTWSRVAEPISDETRVSAPFPGVGLPGLFSKYRQVRVGGQVGVIVCSRIGFASDQWALGSPSGMISAVASRLRAALAFGGTFKGFIQADGANDGIGGLTTWASNWSSFYTNIAVAVPSASGKPVVYYQLPTTKPTTATQTNWDNVRALQAGWATASRIMVTGQSDGPWIAGNGNLGVHMTAAGFVTLAQAYDAAAAGL